MLKPKTMKILSILFIITGASYVYNDVPEVPLKKTGTCKTISRKTTCPNKEFADQKDS